MNLPSFFKSKDTKAIKTKDGKDYKANGLRKLKSIFIVMDYSEESRPIDCKKMLLSVKSGTQISEQHVVVIIYNLLCAVNFLHSSNIIHRDLKPANLLVDQSSSVRICDFGFSRVLPLKV